MKIAILILVFANLTIFAQYGTWSETDSLFTAREYHAAVKLPNGDVMITGGELNGSFLNSTEFYRTDLGVWEQGPPMIEERASHHMVMIDNENVLIFSGFQLLSSEIYNIPTNTFLPADSIHDPRFYLSTATKLLDGRILLAGGFYNNSGTSYHYKQCEIFDPSTMEWSLVDSMNFGRASHTATLLEDGRIIVTGGGGWNLVEIYDPARDHWEYLAPMNARRDGHQAVLLPDGRLFVGGGSNPDSVWGINSCEVYDPVLDEWKYVGNFVLPHDEWNFHMSLMNDSLIFIHSAIGTEIYNYKIMQSVHYQFLSPKEIWNQVHIKLDDGRIIFIGGDEVIDWQVYQVNDCFIFNSGLISNLVDSPIITSNFFLEQNYPNPFNPTTKISWQSPVGSHQSLKVYDVLGNKITTLVDEYKPTGSYEVEFNAVGLPSGVYFYRLQAGEYIESKKMLLLK